MAFCFSGSLLRANFNIVSLFFLLGGVIVRGKYIFFLFLLNVRCYLAIILGFTKFVTFDVCVTNRYTGWS